MMFGDCSEKRKLRWQLFFDCFSVFRGMEQLKRRRIIQMHNRLKKAVVFGLSACLMLGSLSGCSKKKRSLIRKPTAVTVNGDEISAGLVKFAQRITRRR